MILLIHHPANSHIHFWMKEPQLSVLFALDTTVLWFYRPPNNQRQYKIGEPSLSKSLLCFYSLAFYFPASTTTTIRNDIFRITKQQQPQGFSLLISRRNKMQCFFHWGTWKAFLCEACLTVRLSITLWQQASVHASSCSYGKRGGKRTEKWKGDVLKNISPTLKQAIHILLLGLNIFKYICCPPHWQTNQSNNSKSRKFSMYSEIYLLLYWRIYWPKVDWWYKFV